LAVSTLRGKTGADLASSFRPSSGLPVLFSSMIHT
jgi:hypothetical protein